MSTKNFIKHNNNKKLFELRLQIRTKLGFNLQKKSLDKKKRKNNNNTSMNKTQPSINETFQDKLKNISYIEKPSINVKNISSINKNFKNSKIINQKLSLNSSHNKSNNIMKDFNLFYNKNSLKFNDDKRQFLISSIKRLSHNTSIDKGEHRKKLGIKNKNKKNNNKEIIQYNSSIKSDKNINGNNSVNKTKNNSNFDNNKIPNNKIKMKLKLKNNNRKNKKNSSTLKNNKNYKYNSFIIDHIKTVNNNKILNTKNNNSILDYKYKGRNANNNKNIENFQKYLFSKKLENIIKKTVGDIKFTKNNSLIKKQNNTIYYQNKEKKRNYNQNKKKKYYLNQLSLKNEFKLKQKDNILMRNNKKVINKKKKNNLLKFETKYGKIVDITANDSTENRTKKINDYLEPFNNDRSFHGKRNSINRNSNQKKEISMDNIRPNEKRDEEKKNKINESSLLNNSGILSVNEIEDIICYYDMSDINKEDNFLFYHQEYHNFLKKNKIKIKNLFFDNKSYRQSKIKIKTKLIDSKENSKRKSYK